MPPLAAADAFLVLDFVAGNRLVPNPAFAALLASLQSVAPCTSPRLRTGVALRALDAALSDAGDAPTLLHRARAVLADPGLAPCFPHHLSATLGAPAPAAVADLKRLLDVEWANLPPSALELAADRIAGAGAIHTWANADQAQSKKLRLLVGESREREILGRLGQDASARHPVMVTQVNNAPKTDVANASHVAQEKDGAQAAPVQENAKADCPQEDTSRNQEESVQVAPSSRLKEKFVTREPVRDKGHDVTESTVKATPSNVTGSFAPDNNSNHQTTGSKRSLMEKNPTARVFEWDESDGSGSERPLPRHLPNFKRKPKFSPAALHHKSRKKWSEIQEKTLMEGVEKYGKGNWKDIKEAYPVIFEDRSTVDLKDKFRNLERHLCD